MTLRSELDSVFWIDSLPGKIVPRPPLPGDRQVDVAVIGAGYTGLWTAYYLSIVDPSLRVAVLEREVAGFGASGRNGGWCSGQLAGQFDLMPRRWGIDGATAMATAAHQLVDDIGEVVAREAIDCHYAKGGVLWFATTPKQRERVEKLARQPRKLGFGDADYRLLSAEQTREHLRTPRLYGAVYSPHGAALQPARLARGLADVAERNGVEVFEQTMVRSIDGGRVETSHGTVTADVVVRATEGYTPTIAENERAMVPLQTFVIATEPLAPDLWDEIGLARRETFEDVRLRLFYGQRTADDRIVLGGLGYPYRFRSRVDVANGARIYQRLRAMLVELFPILARTSITHEWGGVFGIPRNMTPGVGFDPATKLAWGGGYLGEGVPAAYLAGRTLADLICGRDTHLTRLPWVGGQSRNWEPEPLRWLGVRGVERAAAVVDKLDRS